LAAAYALAMVTQAGASKISLVGFDGYSADDPRQEEMNDVFLSILHLKIVSVLALLHQQPIVLVKIQFFHQ